MDAPSTDNGRLTKQARQHLVHQPWAVLPLNSGPNDPFAPENEISLEAFALALQSAPISLPLEKFISVEIRTRNKSAFGFLVTTSAATQFVKVDFAGTEVAPMIGNAVQLYLKGVNAEPIKSSSTTNLAAFQLQYPNGILMRETDKSGQIRTVDLCTYPSHNVHA